MFDETGKRVSHKHRLDGGSTLLKVRDSAEGRLTVQYLGNGQLGSDTVTVTSGGGNGKKN
ncbi:MAG: hypothetical protein LH468_04165 [Nocardioides sp.]|nr:hypothetical protein [Nocardioides sp.]